MGAFGPVDDVVRGGIDSLVERAGRPGAGRAAAYLAAVSGLLETLLPGDLIAWNSVDLSQRRVKVCDSSSSGRRIGAIADALIRLGAENPMVASYLTQDTTTTPRRLSDVISTADLRRSRSYRELYRPMGARAQLTILTFRDRSTGAGRCWGVNRSVGDFTDREIDIARALQPVLALLDRAYRVEDAGSGPPMDPGPLTTREQSVLTLLADGFTATQIARVLRVSAATVRKHLEHIYAKLGVHDRLLAVNRARELGLIGGDASLC